MSKTRDPAKTPPRAAPLGCRPRSGACVACSCLRGVRSRGRFRPARALVAVRVTQIWWLSPFRHLFRTRLSQRLYERVVVGVGSDPKPRDGVIVDQAKGSPTDADSNRPNAGRTDLLESEARMPGIIEPESIVLAGCLPDGVGETFQAGKKVILQLRFQRSSTRISRVWPERILARTLSASCSISGWDAANAASQRVSSAISSRMRAAIVSCSAGLHFRSWSMARSSSVVMGRVPARSPAMEPDTLILASETTQREPGETRRSCVPFFGHSTPNEPPLPRKEAPAP
jgi:hypothetical protein